MIAKESIIEKFNIEVTRVIETSGFNTYILEPDVVINEVAVEVLTIKHIDDLFKEMKKINNGEKFWVISVLDKIKSVDRKTAMYANDHAKEFLHGNASIVNTYVAKMIIQFFIRIVKPDWHFNAFTNFQDARQWIEHKRQENQQRG